jgi:hypothetical protein
VGRPPVMHGRLNFLCPDLLRVTTTRAGLAVPFGVIGSRDGQFAVSLFMKIVIPAMELTALPELGAVKIQTIRSFASCEAAAMFSDHCMMYLTRKLYQQPNLHCTMRTRCWPRWWQRAAMGHGRCWRYTSCARIMIPQANGSKLRQISGGVLQCAAMFSCTRLDGGAGAGNRRVLGGRCAHSLCKNACDIAGSGGRTPSTRGSWRRRIYVSFHSQVGMYMCGGSDDIAPCVGHRCSG